MNIMAKTTANISIDYETKLKAQELFNELGMDLSTAVTIFFRQAIRERSIPFEITANMPNDETKEAIRETEYIAAHPDEFKSYSSVDEMFHDILGEDDKIA